MDHVNVIVIGGGITGGAAARRLAERLPSARITLIERETRLGGKMVTIREDGYTVEGGPDSFLSGKPRGVGLCRELGIDDTLQSTRDDRRGSFVLWRGALHPLPEGLSGLVPTRLGPVFRSSLLSPRGKARLAMDFVLPARRDKNDESLGAFVERRLGREAYEHLIEPLMAGIYAGDGRSLSLAATFPQLREGERKHGGLIRGVLAARRAAGATAGTNGAAPPRPGFLTPTTGTATLMDALADNLSQRGVMIRTGVSAIALEDVAGQEREDTARYVVTLDEGSRLVADAVVLATPAHVSANLLDGQEAGSPPIDPIAAARLRDIPHVSSVTMSLAFQASDVHHPLRGYGYVVPRVANRRILASSWTSSKWAHRAPDGSVLLRAFVGRAGGENPMALSDQELIMLARDEFRETLGITATPTHTWVVRWPLGSPQYTLGHLDRVDEIERRIAAHPGLAIAGCALRGVGLPDCIRSGEAAAENLSAQP